VANFLVASLSFLYRVQHDVQQYPRRWSFGGAETTIFMKSSVRARACSGSALLRLSTAHM